MKKLIIVVVALFALNISAAEPVEPNKFLRSQIISLLGDNLTFDFDQKEVTIEVLFTLNKKSELIIISTNAPSQSVETSIKKKLNYKKVDFKGNKPGEMFLLPLKIKNS
jgi:hypothetical protein